MKTNLCNFAIVFALASIVACSKTDNYPPPDQTLRGRIIDAGNGTNVQSEISGEAGIGTRIELREISWSNNPTPMYLAAMQDGTYNNTKVFAGTYKLSAEGAFVPLVQTGANPSDKSQTAEVRGGVTTVDFSVEPFLRIAWDGEPTLNADGTVTAKVIVTRGTNNPNYQLAVTDINLYVNNYPYVGNHGTMNDPRFSKTGAGTNAMLGCSIAITTKAALPKQRDWYLRAGARTAYPNGGRPYNYNEIKKISIP
ncbi:MAG: hypothetical protein CRN43_05635 [Candidatus Nephrothrix sp. EaCA]|nr:MAG: hypothetical protein CRN43_05635 [Candidatus Nephrothrix sp. EaCA]